MTTRSDIRNTTIRDLMSGRHGLFADRLGDVLLNTDNGIPLIERIAKAYGDADGKNRERFMQAFPNLWEVLELSEQDRLDRLLDAFQPFLDEMGVLA